MFAKRIDWDTPPSQRHAQPAVGKRLILDAGVASAALIIDWLLVSALLGYSGVNQQGLREYMIDVVPGATSLAWGVVAVVTLAMLFVAVDALRVLSAVLRVVRHEVGRSERDSNK